jgi:hypothetical protein
MIDLETSAFVGEEVSYFQRAEMWKASPRIEGLRVTLSERLYRVVPLVEFLENIGPRLNLVRSIGVQGPHGLFLLAKRPI